MPHFEGPQLSKNSGLIRGKCDKLLTMMANSPTGQTAATVNELAKDWQQSGLQKGDLILLHTSIKRLIRTYRKKGIRLTPKDILHSFLIAVGETGTLLFPAFNFGFAEGQPFSLQDTPSEMGILSETARHHPDAIRTGHPIYSFTALGHLAHEFKDVDNESGYGVDSPFAICRSLGGKVAVLDLPDQNSMTFYHYVEEMLEVPYRYYKSFTGPYLDHHTRQTKTYRLFVRDLERGVVTKVENMESYLWKTHFYLGAKPLSGNGLRTIHMDALFEETQKIITSGKALGMLYEIED